VQRYEKYFNSAQNKVKKKFFLPFSLAIIKKSEKFAGVFIIYLMYNLK